MGRLFRIAEFAAFVLPAAIVLCLVLHYGVNVPFFDQWDFVGNLALMKTGHLRLLHLFDQHNEHRMVFPKLVMLALAWVTDWNIIIEMLASIVLAIMILWMILKMGRPVLREMGAAGRLWAIFSSSALVFSLAQWENWLWGWQIQWYLSVLAAVSCIAAATSSLREPASWRPMLLSAAAAVICHFSIASGIALWPIGALIFAFHPRRRLMLTFWLCVAAASTALYFSGYRHPPHHPSSLLALEQPLGFARYLASYLSGPLGQHWVIGVAAFAGFVVLGIAAGARYRDRVDVVLPWIALGFFACANAFITGVGRIGFGPDQAFSSRYVTISLLLSISLVFLGSLAIGTRSGTAWTGGRVASAAVGALTLTASVVAADVASLESFAMVSREQSTARECILAIDEAADECLKRIYPDPNTVRDRSKQLAAIAWSGLQWTPETPPGTVRLSSPEGVRLWRLRPAEGREGWLDRVVVAEGKLVVGGWALHPKGNNGARQVLVVIGDMLIGSAAVGEDRPDVASAFSDPGLLRSGWTLRRDTVPKNGSRKLKAYLVYDDQTLVPMHGEAALP